MSGSGSCSKICFNPDCRVEESERWRKGWRLRSGEIAELCDHCGSTYEEMRFCEVFHSDTAGWRSCESCGKRLHCGCVASLHTFVLLDTGGVECVACARKSSLIMASNQIWPPSLFLPLHLPERTADLSVKNWNHITGPSSGSGQWRQPPPSWHASNGHSEIYPWMPYTEVDRSNSIDRPISGDHSSGSAQEKKHIEDLPERKKSTSLKFGALTELVNGNIRADTATTFATFNGEEGNIKSLQDPGHLTGGSDPSDPRKGVIAEPDIASRLNFETHASSCIDASLQSSRDDSSSQLFGLAVSFASPTETNDPTRVSGSQIQRRTPAQMFTKAPYPSPLPGLDSSGELQSQIRGARPRGEGRGRNQLLPRYWPRITDQELQQISGDSNSVITPLFEKMLSASDAGRIGRLVLPKKCAEAYFPPISQPEGLPLKVQDAKGKEWVFQFRFWPNNNSRMYVLEGVTPCIQSMQLQAGDTVTFSRIDPERKLVMGFRKASSIHSEQDTPPKTGNGVTPSEEVNPVDPSYTWSKHEKGMPKEGSSTKSSLLPNRRKSSTLGSKSKRLRIDNEESIELKLTWEEAQDLLRPPPNHPPSIVVIEGHEFEEYEEAPVLGKPTVFTSNHAGEKNQWAQCEDCYKWRKLPMDSLLPPRWTCSDNSWDPKRSSCSTAQELSSEQLEDLLFPHTGDRKGTEAAELKGLEGSLDALANLALLAENGDTPFAQATTKHPRHRPGCTCIVCIQPPSGKGPKHKQTCTCNVCLTVKRRFRTLMMRREKRQSEKEAETTRKKQNQNSSVKIEDEEPKAGAGGPGERVDEHPHRKTDAANLACLSLEDDLDNRKSSPVARGGIPACSPSISPYKVGIDLNCQPEREEELALDVDTSVFIKLLRDTEISLQQQEIEVRSLDDLEPVGHSGARDDSGIGSHDDADEDPYSKIPVPVLASTSAPS